MNFELSDIEAAVAVEEVAGLVNYMGVERS